MSATNQEFGQAVTALLAERGLSLREVEAATGLSHALVRSLRQGHVPKYALLRRFIDGLELDRNEWLTLAGRSSEAPETGVELLKRGLRELAGRNQVAAVDFDWSTLGAELTIREAYLLLADLEEATERDSAFDDA